MHLVRQLALEALRAHEKLDLIRLGLHSAQRSGSQFNRIKISQKFDHKNLLKVN